MAGALSTVPVEQKQAGGSCPSCFSQAFATVGQELMKNAISGFGQLPADQRAEACRFDFLVKEENNNGIRHPAQVLRLAVNTAAVWGLFLEGSFGHTALTQAGSSNAVNAA